MRGCRPCSPARGSATLRSTPRSTACRRGVAATRRCFAAALGCRRRRPFSRRGWPSDCAPPCSPGGWRSTSTPGLRGSAPSPAPGSWSRPPPGARVRARAAVLAINASAAAVRPVRSRLAVSSTHMIVTEPVPDVLAELGWSGGECISTARRYLHYFRTTDDDRIAFGWGGGRLAYGARLGGRVELDPQIATRLRAEIVRFFPALRGRRIDAAWGGPVDVSPTRLPCIGSLAGGRIHYVCGFTGNGVGPAHLSGAILAALALDQRNRADPARSGRAPPAPGAPGAVSLPRRQPGAVRPPAQGGSRGSRAAGRLAQRAGDRDPGPARDPRRAIAAGP